MPARRDKKSGRWIYQKVVKFPDGSKKRIWGSPTRNTKTAAERAEREHIEREMAAFYAPSEDPALQAKEVPTIEEFWPEFMSTYVAANNKVSEMDSKRSMYGVHIRPAFGKAKLDSLGRREIEVFKAKLCQGGLKRKTINNVLTVLGKLLNYAEEIELIEHAPGMHLLKIEGQKFRFLDFDEYEALLDAAESEPEWLVAILLAGSAGLRLGEIRALQWSDWERRVKKLTIHQAFYRGVLGATKGWNLRTLPMVTRLERALRAVRHLRGPFVLCNADGSPKKYTQMRSQLPRLCKRAGIEETSWHPLRHTFCSHLAMLGAPAKVIQELAGHANLATTLKYMHLAEGAKDQAIALLERGPARGSRGDLSCKEYASETDASKKDE